MSDYALDPVTLALVSLTASIASNHPKKGLCRLRGLGIPKEQIDLVVDIARHLRDEACEMLDSEFDAVFSSIEMEPEASPATPATAQVGEDCGCSTTARKHNCC